MRSRLTLLVGATVALVLLAFSVPMALLLRNAAIDQAVTSATQEGESLAAVVAAADRPTVESSLSRLNASSAHAVTVFWQDGTRLGADAERSQAVDLAATGRSITAAAPGGREILFSVQTAGGEAAVIRVFVDDSELTAGLGQSLAVLGVLAVALFGVGVVLADRFARVLLVPLADMARVSHRLAGGELEARAEAGGPPELREVAGALNGLAERIRDLLAAERERAADISHRLRTPLTVLRLEVEAIEDAQARGQVEAAVDGVEQAVTTVIAQTRAPEDDHDSCDAARVVADRVEFFSALAEETERPCTTELAAGPLPVGVGRVELGAAMDALLGNVFSHTPDGTGFTVRLTARAAGGAVLEVADDGPGFGDVHVVNRGASPGGSSGLGLDIVRRTAAATGGWVELGAAAPGSGARVTVVLLPPVPAAEA